MATISALRETLKSQVGDIARLTLERRYSNQLLNQALFEALRQHNYQYRWESLPVPEEQLILLLAKERLARDKALEYALDVRVQAGSNFSSEKQNNSSVLLQVAHDLHDDYEYQRTRIESQSNYSGDIYVGNLTRVSRTVHINVPVQLASPPPKPILKAVKYQYYPNAFTNAPVDSEFQPPPPFGRLIFDWDRIDPGDLAYIRFYATQNPRGPMDTWIVVRTVYDYYCDTLAFDRIAGPWITTREDQMAKNELWCDQTLIPTGSWYFRMCAVNWNMLVSMSDTVQLEVDNSIYVMADTLILN